MSRFRCSAAARDRQDALAGTASTVQAFLLLEEPGPWGADAWRDARLPAGLGVEVLSRTAEAGVRPLLIRRERRGDGGRRRVFAAFVRAGAVGLFEAGSLADAREVLDLDLEALGRGRSVGLDPWTEPVFAVCTHGRHDACCAERGRPVMDALRAVEPQTTWGVSHIGGDRFAGNLLVLGEGLYYGGLDVTSVRAVVSAHRAGRLDLDHLRGRTCWPMPVQAAEIGLRRHLGIDRLDGVRLLRRERVDDGVAASFAVGVEVWRVLVRALVCEPRRLTCAAVRPQAATVWECAGVARVTEPGPGGAGPC